MLGFAIVDRQHDAGATAIWLASREGARVRNTNAVVIQQDDETYDAKVQALVADRAVVLTDGTAAPVEFAHALNVSEFATLIDETAAHQQRIIDAITDHMTRTRNGNLVIPDFPAAPTLIAAQHNEPASRALSVANYVGAVWAAWLTTEEQRVRRTGDHRNDASTRIMPEELASPVLADFPPEFGARVKRGAGGLMLNYTAIDFETANSYRGSPCSVGLVRVRNGVPVAETHWLMRPPERVDHFAGFNTALHGITPEMVATKPRWKDVLPAIVDFIGDDVVVAHNAGFDIGVIRDACAADNVEWPQLRFLCTMVLSRRALSLPTYRLPYVVEALGATVAEHHDALADAHGVVHVIRGLAAAQGVETLDDLAGSVGVSIGRIAGGKYTGSVVISRGGDARLVQPNLNPNADPDGYLFGRVVVFTGTLMSMTRQIAWEECARVGAVAGKSTTKYTNILVVGDINPAVLRPGSTITGKARRAFELQEKGQDIEVMTEDDFLRCLDGEPVEGPEALLSHDDDCADCSTPPTSPPSHLRKVSLAERPKPKPPKPPRPLRRTPVATTQPCSTDGCTSTAAFKTRTKSTWCEQHIIEQQYRGGLKPLEPFTRPDDWQLTECVACTVQAHYRFEYTLDKNNYGEPTCRACYWRQWAAESRELQGPWARVNPVPYEEAETLAESRGYEYLGPLTMPSLPDDPHHVRCGGCGRISAERLGDMSFGCCTCNPRV